MQRFEVTDEQLSQKLGRAWRPSAMELREYQLGLLSPERARVVSAFVARHPYAARRLESLREFLADVERGPGAAGGSAAVRQFVAQPVPAAEVSHLFPSAGQRTAGQRSGPGQPKAVYCIGNVCISVSAEKEDDDPRRRALKVVISRLQLDNLEVIVRRSDSQEVVAKEAAFLTGGERIAGVADLPPGTYDVEIRGGEPVVEIHVKAVQVP
ncbi:MAG: hypothetical protein AB1791_18360 [Chloroflexota bacterium]